MNDAFQRRVAAAAVAGWWTLLIAAGFLSLQWGVYLLVMSARPAWMVSLWGGDVSWAYIQNLWIWIVAVFKLCFWLLALVVIWLSLWARQLRKGAGGA